MTDPSAPDALPEAVIRKKKGLPTVWVIPIVAALVGGWLWYKALQEQGPQITITFSTADGLEAGKTKIKYKDLEIGHVTTIELSADLEQVVVKAELAAGTDDYLKDGTRFWVVKPRIGAEGVSGLGTIVSGAYIAMDISLTGEPMMDYVGLEDPPARATDAEGLRIKIRAPSLGSIGTGTTVSHLGINMGDVEGYTFLPEEGVIEFALYIEKEFQSLVRTTTRFWNASGFDVNLGSDGFQFHAESLETVLMGGIAFDNVKGVPRGPQAPQGHVFELIENEAEAQTISNDPTRTIAYFDEPVGGLTPGAPVQFQGIEIGQVVSVDIEFDRQALTFRMPVIMETYANRLTTSTEADPNETKAQRLQRLVDRGFRAQLATANILTGARKIDVGFFPDEPAVFRSTRTDIGEVPTIPSTAEALNEMIKQLPQIVTDVRQTVDGVANLVEAVENGSTLQTLQSAAESLESLLAELDSSSAEMLGSVDGTLDDMRGLVDEVKVVVSDFKVRAPELFDSIQATIDTANELLQDSDGGVESVVADLPAIQHDLKLALQEIAAGMRSLAGLADYLERHPEALLSGKSDTGGL